MICGPCAVGLCHQCTGFLKAEFGFCACSDRGHVDQGERVSLERQLEQLAAIEKLKGRRR